MTLRPELEAVLHSLRFRRHMTSRHLPRVESGHCRWCGVPVTPPRRSWCSDACVREYMIRSSSNAVQARVLKRDQGVCAQCGIDTLEVREWMKKAHKACGVYKTWTSGDNRAQWGPWGVDHVRQLWEADHIVPVVEGGGCCGLENYQTLCIPCHKRETAKLATRRAMARERVSEDQIDLFDMIEANA